MKKSLIIVVIITCCTTTMYGQSSIKEFEWLIGNWKKVDKTKERVSYESWILKNEELHGLGFTLNKKDTVFKEQLTIRKINNYFYYIANVKHNTTPVHFKVTSFSFRHFIVKNPQHDFPKKIEYQLIDNLLNAHISDNDKTITFTYKKVN